MKKRVVDIYVSLALIVLFFPLIAVLLMLTLALDGAPVIFSQERIGKDGIPFRLFKIRSMRIDTNGPVCSNSEQNHYNLFGTEKNLTTTSLGSFIRKTKLDELPQLWNVLKGDMSIVGPRPEIRKWVETYPKLWAYVLQIRPGITDPASLRYRNEEQMLAESNDPERTYRELILPDKLELYKSYVTDHSLTKDLNIILQTIWVVIRGI